MAGHFNNNIVKTALCLGLVLLTSLCSQVLASVTVEGVRLWRAPDHTRLVFDLSGPVEHTVFPLDNPARLVIDMARARLPAGMPSLALDETPITSVRSAPRNGSDLRVVLDLGQPVNPRSFTLADNEQYGHRLVIDLYDQGQKRAKTLRDLVDRETGRRDILVGIDAGHGGEDPGAIGANRAHEKEVVLAISRALKQLADREPGFKGVLIRTGDYYIPLRKRTDLARQARVDLFVSVHADAFKSPAARGASVFALSPRGATSETARYLAERENRADLIGGVGSVRLADKDDMLASVLLDLSMTATLNSSLEVGKEVLDAMGGIARLHKKQVEQAGFVVLKSPDIPSILVETGFISNPTEARQLSSAAYQRKMANAIFSGIKRYFYARPPLGTWVAANSQRGADRVHTIGRGDTLSDIAERYNVSVEALKRHNQLQSSVIRVGQRIRIPAS